MKALADLWAKDPPGLTAMGIVLSFGALVATLAGTTLLWPWTALDRMWALNPRAYAELTPLGGVVGMAFILFGMTLAVAAVGWFNVALGGGGWLSPLLRPKYSEIWSTFPGGASLRA